MHLGKFVENAQKLFYFIPRVFFFFFSSYLEGGEMEGALQCENCEFISLTKKKKEEGGSQWHLQPCKGATAGSTSTATIAIAVGYKCTKCVQSFTNNHSSWPHNICICMQNELSCEKQYSVIRMAVPGLETICICFPSVALDSTSSGCDVHAMALGVSWCEHSGMVHSTNLKNRGG